MRISERGIDAPSPTYILEDVDTDSGDSSEEDEVELMPWASRVVSGVGTWKGGRKKKEEEEQRKRRSAAPCLPFARIGNRLVAVRASLSGLLRSEGRGVPGSDDVWKELSAPW
jgi:hypothetical protein